MNWTLMKNSVFFCWEENVHLKALVISTNLEFGCGKNVLHCPYEDLVFFRTYEDLVLLYEDALKDLLEWSRMLLAPSYWQVYKDYCHEKCFWLASSSALAI
jgi:hypothetical protein